MLGCVTCRIMGARKTIHVIRTVSCNLRESLRQITVNLHGYHFFLLTTLSLLLL